MASSRFAVRGPTPKIAETDSGARIVCTSSGRITRKPSGLSMSLASLAMNLELATPTDATSPVSRRMSRLIARPISAGSPPEYSQPVTSRKASSSESGSTSGVYERKIDMILRLSAVYFSKFGLTTTSSGHSRSASAVDIAERTPKRRAG